jgi:hypothetical protein
MPLLKARPLFTWLEEREPLIGRQKILFGIPRTSPDPLPEGVTAIQAVEAVESTSWAKGLAEGVCGATGLTGAPYNECVTNYKRKVALGALGLTSAQLIGEPIIKHRGPGRPKEDKIVPQQPEVPAAAPAVESRPKKYEKTVEIREHFINGKKTGNWMQDIRDEISQGNEVYFTGPPNQSGTKLLVTEKSGKSFISRQLSIQELDEISKAMKKDKSLVVGVQLPGTSAVDGAKKA